MYRTELIHKVSLCVGVNKGISAKVLKKKMLKKKGVCMESNDCQKKRNPGDKAVAKKFKSCLIDWKNWNENDICVGCAYL